jgi:hypothetical protein
MCPVALEPVSVYTVAGQTPEVKEYRSPDFFR